MSNPKYGVWSLSSKSWCTGSSILDLGIYKQEDIIEGISFATADINIAYVYFNIMDGQRKDNYEVRERT